MCSSVKAGALVGLYTRPRRTHCSLLISVGCSRSRRLCEYGFGVCVTMVACSSLPDVDSVWLYQHVNYERLHRAGRRCRTRRLSEGRSCLAQYCCVRLEIWMKMCKTKRGMRRLMFQVSDLPSICALISLFADLQYPTPKIFNSRRVLAPYFVAGQLTPLRPCNAGSASCMPDLWDHYLEPIRCSGCLARTSWSTRSTIALLWKWALTRTRLFGACVRDYTARAAILESRHLQCANGLWKAQNKRVSVGVAEPRRATQDVHEKRKRLKTQDAECFEKWRQT